jgi:DNA repair exonuclease SbcCD nuclease subunit
MNVTEKVQGAAICGGDVFHVKKPQHDANPYSIAIDTAILFSRFPTGGVYGIVGNHDVREDNKATLPNQPLNVAIATGAYHDSAVHPVIFRPSKQGPSVMVVGFEYSEDADALLAEVMAYKKPEDVDHMVAMLHAHSAPGGRSTYFGTPQLGFNEFNGSCFDVICWGHDHGRYDVAQTEDRCYHIHPGSLSRAALSSDETDRPVMLAVLSFSDEGLKVKEIEVPTKPLSLAFHVADRKVAGVVSSVEVQEFFAEVDASVAQVESDDPIDILHTLCDEKEVLDIIKDACQLR